MGKLSGGKREDFGCGDCWGTVGLGKLEVANYEGGVLCGWLRAPYLASSGWSEVGNGDKHLGSCPLVIKFWLFGARSCCLASWIVSRDSCLTPPSLAYSRLPSWASYWAWFPGQAAAGCGSEIYFYTWSDHYLCVYSVSHCTVWDILTLNASSETFF